MNSVGYSDFSSESRFAAALPPQKPAAPTKVMDSSSKTSVYVKWSESAETDVLGYRLYMSEGTSEFAIVYEASNALVREFNATGLKSGQVYQFTVTAFNWNGDSQMSDALVKYSCVLPSQPLAISKLSVSRT